MSVDLRFPELPHQIGDNGEWAEVLTDFRVWLAWGEAAREHVFLPTIFPNGEPDFEWVKPALEFYMSANDTPRGRSEGARTLDLLSDGEFIVGAFQQAYNVDLTSCSMHWHRFLALLRSLPSDTRLAQIMGYRAWRESDEKRKPADARKELRERWALGKTDDAELVELQRSWFEGVSDA